MTTLGYTSVNAGLYFILEKSKYYMSISIVSSFFPIWFVTKYKTLGVEPVCATQAKGYLC